MKGNNFHSLAIAATSLLAACVVFGNSFEAPEDIVRKEVQEVRSLKAVLKDAKAIDAI